MVVTFNTFFLLHYIIRKWSFPCLLLLLGSLHKSFPVEDARFGFGVERLQIVGGARLW